MSATWRTALTARRTADDGVEGGCTHTQAPDGGTSERSLPRPTRSPAYDPSSTAPQRAQHPHVYHLYPIPVTDSHPVCRHHSSPSLRLAVQRPPLHRSGLHPLPVCCEIARRRPLGTSFHSDHAALPRSSLSFPYTTTQLSWLIALSGTPLRSTSIPTTGPSPTNREAPRSDRAHAPARIAAESPSHACSSVR